MKRNVTLLAALVVLSVWMAGCNSGPTQKEIKDAFVHQLIVFCAEVGRQLAKIPGGAKAEPARRLLGFLGTPAARKHFLDSGVE